MARAGGIVMTDIDTSNPYADGYDAYWRAGWRGVLPLPYRKKKTPREEYTGHQGVYPSYADCATWADDGPRNICLRMDPTVLGIDVDDYNGKGGGDTLASLVAKYGALPPTVLSTSRDDGISGIRFYRIPEGWKSISAVRGIEFIQKHHRYAVVWPSIHPDTGNTYRWVDERTGRTLDTAPDQSELPELPATWLAGLANDGEAAAKQDIDAIEAMDILAAMPTAGDDGPCRHIRAAAGIAMNGEDRHDAYNKAALAVVGAGRRGCPGAVQTIRRLRASFISELTDPVVGRETRDGAEAEWKRGLLGALKIVAGEEPGTVCPDDVLDWIEAQPPTSNPATDDGEIIEDTPYDQAVRRRYAELKVTDDAKAMLAALKAGQAPPIGGIHLDTFLDQPDEEERYRIDGLWPAEGRVLLAAAAKSGKTTMVAANLIPCLVDGRPFLGQHHGQQVTGRVIYLNMEVGERTLRRWLRDSHIANTRSVVVSNLRGKASALALGSDAGRTRFAGWLRGLDAEVVILDPLAPVLAALGLDENSNTDIALFFSWWSAALTEAGVADDLVVHHTGHGGDRSRGASRLLDEPDAIWTLTKDAEDADDDEDDAYGPAPVARYLHAYGRDVDLPTRALHYDTHSRALTLTGQGRAAANGDRIARRIWRVMADGAPRSRNAIVTAAGGNRTSTWAKVDEMVASGELVKAGVKGSSFVLPDAFRGQE